MPPGLSLRGLSSVAAAAWRSFNEDKAPRLAAALAYYTVYSIPPLVVLVIAVAGLAFGRDAVQGRVIASIAQLVGPEGALAVRDMLRSSQQTHTGATIIGVATLLLGASGVFGALKDALNTLWEVEPKPGMGLRMWLGQYVFSMMALFGTLFLLIVSLAVSTGLSAFGDWLAHELPGGTGVWQSVNFVVSLGVLAVLFAMLFKYIPDGRVAWRDALIGGLVTSVLFTLGEQAIGLYLGRTNVGSAFGAAGSLVVMLTWIYYSTMIFFYGAEFTKSYASLLGDRVVPDPHARPVTPEARRQQGIRWKDPRAAHGAADSRARREFRDGPRAVR
jgi:membrane protein